MEKYIALETRVRALESGGGKEKKKRITPTQKKKIQVTDDQMGPMSRRLLSMLNSSGKSSRNLTLEEHEEIQRIVKKEGAGKLKGQVELLEKFYKHAWKRKPGEPCMWTFDLATLLNNRNKYIDRAESFLAARPTKQPVRVATELTYTEPAYNWRSWVIDNYGGDSESLVWDSLPSYIKKEACNQK